jgi:dihydrodipicolinate synthase/N-acetylneuraminate lyase
LTGNGTIFLDALRAGGTGAILAVGCVVPEICVEIVRAFEAKDTERAASLQINLTPLAAAVTTGFGIGGLKASLDMAGYHGGSVRNRHPARAGANGPSQCHVESSENTSELDKTFVPFVLLSGYA